MNLCLSISEWIQIIGTLGTLGAAIAAWKSAGASKNIANNGKNQIEIMKDQNRKSFEPNLVFKGNYQKSDYKDIPTLNINVYNIGMGAAKNIIVKWDYTLADQDIFEDDEKVVHFKYGKVSAINKELTDVNHINYILPAHINESYTELEIPKVPLWYYILKLNKTFQEVEKDERDDSNLTAPFKINGVLEFVDITEKEYTIEIELELSLISINENEVNFHVTIN